MFSALCLLQSLFNLPATTIASKLNNDSTLELTRILCSFARDAIYCDDFALF